MDVSADGGALDVWNHADKNLFLKILVVKYQQMAHSGDHDEVRFDYSILSQSGQRVHFPSVYSRIYGDSSPEMRQHYLSIALRFDGSRQHCIGGNGEGELKRAVVPCEQYNEGDIWSWLPSESYFCAFTVVELYIFV